ncbi:hypothetical protein WME99_33455 [Sorangium sp. So ce136]|uniref:hypothetical protein n=1 Tax=Sorangium sp. So ce136 TaxID=3133284 RepID=UPI003F0E8D20
MAAGAPADLVEAAHHAALDEERHARLCLALASAYRCAPIEPGALALGAAVAVESGLAALAAAATREGCVGELLAAEQLAHATETCDIVHFYLKKAQCTAACGSALLYRA